MDITTTNQALLRLLQLSSAALPVGGYSFSQGLEYAIDSGWLKTSGDVEQWLAQQLTDSLSRIDLPILQRQIAALELQENEKIKALSYWNAHALACRETMELRLTDTAMGAALIKLLGDLNIPLSALNSHDVSFVTAFAIAAQHWGISPSAASYGFLWSWLENQVAAATKLVPLGQTTAQQLLGQLLEDIPKAIDFSLTVDDENIGASLPALAMASAWHEHQYSRLFRS